MTAVRIESRAICCALLILGMGGAVQAQEPGAGGGPAKQMAAQCEKRMEPDVAELGLIACAGFLDGVMSTHRMMVSFYGARPAYCVPDEGISIQRALDVFVGYLKSHPADGDASARQVVLLALADAYPCRDAPPR